MTLIDTEMVAALLHCSVRHVRNLTTRGKLTNKGAPHKHAYDLNEVMELIHAGQIQPAPKKGRPPNTKN